jgi:hypothetical protein
MIEKNVTRSAVTVDSITVGQYQKANTETAMLRQDITTVAIYPGAVHSSDMQQNIFGSEDFNDESQNYTSVEHRVAFMDVPEGMTEEQVQAKIPSTACLYKVLSNQPILTDNAKNAISRGLTSKADIAKSQAVRNPDTGELILDKNGNVQYRKVFFWASQKDDIDERGQGEPYISEELKQELENSSVSA